MILFLRYIFNSMKEKKLREVLLLFAISISSGLLFGTLVWANSFSNSLEKMYKEYYEARNIYVTSNSDNAFFKIDDFDEKVITDIVPEIRLTATNYDYSDDLYIDIISRDNQYNTDITLLQGNLPNENKNEAVISVRMTDKLKLKIGDTFKFYINGQTKSVNITGISANNGPFTQDKVSECTILISYKYLCDELGIKDQYNFIRANSADENIDKSIRMFKDQNEALTAKELYSNDDINAQVSKTVNTYYLMIIFVILITVVIVQGAKKLIITERIQIIGTFFSQGALKKNVRNILFLEGIVEGFIGGLLGLVIGYAFCWYVNYKNSPLREYGIYEEIAVKSYLILVPIVFAILMTVISCIIPFRQIKYMQIKDVILNIPFIKEVKQSKAYILGIILFAFGTAVAFMENNFASTASIAAFICSFVGLLILYPKIIQGISGIILKRMDGRGVRYLITNNLKTSKILMTNISLMIIASTALIIIFTISDSVLNGVVGIYEDLNYDVAINHIGNNSGQVNSYYKIDALIDEIEKLDYIDSDRITEDYSLIGTLNGASYWLYGIDLDFYDSFNTYIDFKSGQGKEAYVSLKKNPSDKLIISNEVARKLSLNEDSCVKVEINGVEKEYYIAGIINTKMMNMGNGIFISNEQIHSVFHVDYPTSIYLTGLDKYKQEDLKSKLKSDIGYYGFSVQTKKENTEVDISETSSLVQNLRIFGAICLVMSLFGVLNNLAISFIQRKKEIAVLSSVGMVASQRNRMLLGEAFFSACWSTLFSIGYLYIGARLCSKITRLIGLGLDVTVNGLYVWIYALAIILTGTLACTFVLIKNRKISIIDEIRYE